MDKVYFFILALILVATAGVIAAFLLLYKKDSSASKFKSKSLMSNNEIEFFERLKTALPECYIFPQVALSAIIEADSNDPKEKIRLRNKFAQKYADYIIADKNFSILAIIELDDRTHSTEKDRERDSMTNAAGYKTFRYLSKKKPDTKTIRNDILS